MCAKIKIFQKGFNYSQDGPGNRLVYHLHGCNMRCPWCANPEGIYSEMGGADGMCESRSVSELTEEALRSAPMFFDGGGITLTGGEPTIQFDSVRKFLENLKSHKVHTAMETNGTSQKLPQLFPLIDYLVIDFKSPDSEIHAKFTGIGQDEYETIKTNILLARKAESLSLIRIPLVNGVNADDASMHGFTDFLKGGGFNVELLLYHEYGKEKYKRLGMKYSIVNGFVPPGVLQMFEENFRQNGINIVKT